ncbi:hypothetical protein CVT26_001602 [Gymnopilus dilepis]|uniref:Uncharacterized protein n=1 Tax=Gymnopilus dilepis TaxID=231916 RepID=A0A409WVR2_9AGAR|nr:hypothetical protein CVT26_001602 [Gymnopilus dilepis]
MSFSSATDNDNDFIKTNFTTEEETYLSEFIPAWRGKFYGSQTQPKKGLKKSWVVQIPYVKFIEKFYADGDLQPHASTLQEKIYRWFLNRTNDGNTRPFKARSERAPALKKPRATNGFNVFTQEKKEEITKLQREKTNESSPSNNLTPYKESCKELWACLPPKHKEDYAQKATERNDLIKNGPTEEDIERHANQSQIIQNTLSSLSSLTGYHWTGHGDAAFFVLGAHRKKDGGIVTFYGSVLDDDDYASKGFHRTFPDFNSEIAEPFKAWAEKVIPVGTSPQSTISDCPANVLAVGTLADGFPVLPETDLESITPKDSKALLQLFIAAAWEHRYGVSEQKPPVPWGVLSSLSRDSILQDPLPFNDFESLDPFTASTGEIYSILKTIMAEQKKGVRPFKFLPGKEALPAILTIDHGETGPIPFGDRHEPETVVATPKQQMDFSPRRPKGHQVGSVPLSDYPMVTCQVAELETDSEKANKNGKRRLHTASGQQNEQPGSEENEGTKTDRVSYKKRRSQTQINDEVETGHPVRKIRKSLPTPEVQKAGTGGTMGRNRSRAIAVKNCKNASTSLKSTNKAATATLPPRTQSARIRNKNYKNKAVTVRKR